MEDRPTASIIIIGDEILKGQTKDTNSYFLSRELYEYGVKVCHISVISDDVNIIAAEVAEHSRKFSFVITSGGIGPTHDDVTYEGIAKAFNEKLILNKNLHNILSVQCHDFGWDETATARLSNVPESSEIHPTGKSNRMPCLPVVSVRNVFIFPGIPSYLEFLFGKLKNLFCGTNHPYISGNLFVNATEFDITEILDSAVDEFKHKVKFGSYPNIDNKYYQVKLTLEADTENNIKEAEAYLRNHLPPNSVVSQYPPDSEESLKLMMTTCDENTTDNGVVSVLKESLQVLEECFDKYSVKNVCLSFNGGKDCTLLLHLTYLYLVKKYPAKKRPKLKALYIDSDQSFPEIKRFIQLSVERYNLELISYERPIKDALSKLKNDHLHIQAVLMGSRESDPSCSNLQSFQMTDNDWPQLMRVNPLINWTFPQVWKALRLLQVPYCSLYDRGYTSLGCQNNTLPNEQLQTKTKDGETYYLPAYLLKEPKQERKGREGN